MQAPSISYLNPLQCGEANGSRSSCFHCNRSKPRSLSCAYDSGSELLDALLQLLGVGRTATLFRPDLLWPEKTISLPIAFLRVGAAEDENIGDKKTRQSHKHKAVFINQKALNIMKHHTKMPHKVCS